MLAPLLHVKITLPPDACELLDRYATALSASRSYAVETLLRTHPTVAALAASPPPAKEATND